MKMKNILNSLFPWLAMTTLLSLQGCENEEGTAIHSRDTVSFEIDAGEHGQPRQRLRPGMPSASMRQYACHQRLQP